MCLINIWKRIKSLPKKLIKVKCNGQKKNSRKKVVVVLLILQCIAIQLKYFLLEMVNLLSLMMLMEVFIFGDIVECFIE
jgi:hypothetical protein